MKLLGERLYIRKIEVTDAEELLAHQLRNKEFLDPFRPLRSEAEFTLAGIRERLQRKCEEWEQDQSYSFHVYLLESDLLIGSIDLMFVRRGPAQSAMLGYELDQEQNGKGYMTEAVELCVSFGFEHAKLHRIEAGVMPSNIGSNRVLEKVGFSKEGVLRKNVKINGAWEDHCHWAMLETDWELRKRS